jgi:nicotinate-nucleotide pyrophosphorylase (carboxylating)
LRLDQDITCQALVPHDASMLGVVTAKSAGVVCGLQLFARVFTHLGGGVEVVSAREDGAAAKPGDEVLRCRGNAAIMLMGERTALNFCQRLSGTATLTRRFVDAVKGTKARILDTRKTTPGMRVLQKHAVVAGGGEQHRMGLYDQVLIKDNHIALMPAEATEGRAAESVRRCRALLGSDIMIEVEIEDLRDLDAVIKAGADIVLLDNMDAEQLRRAVAMRGAQKVQLEASGGITLANVRQVAETGIDRISVGALCHSAPVMDLSLTCTVA